MFKILPAEWEVDLAKKHASLVGRIPAAWTLSESDLPGDDVLDVLDVPRKSGILNERELEITEVDDVGVLLARLADRTYSSEEVTTAFCKRAAIAQQVTNCLTEFWFDQAIEYARSLDTHLSKTNQPLGPLHGLPISLKDQFQFRGVEANMGWASWIGRISEVDSDLVVCLRKAGAVFFCRTNVPQSLMCGEGANHVYGTTVNPYQRQLTSGGSSAGEGALIAMKGSPLGVGTDVGGSIRIPAAYCGIYGLKPTTRRVPYGNALNAHLGAEAIESAAGPMSSSLSGLVNFMKGLMGTKPWLVDAQVVPIPWRDELFRLEHIGGKDTKLCFGFYDFNGCIHVHPPIKRAVASMVSALRAAGHEVIEWKPEDHAGAFDLFSRIFGSDGGADLRETTRESREPIVPHVKPVSAEDEITVWQSWQLNLKKYKYREAYLRQRLATAASTSTGRAIDGLIAPVMSTVAFPHTQSKNMTYTGICNLLDIPSVVIPVDFVNPGKDIAYTDFEPVSELDQQNQDTYDPELMAGCPTSVQIMGMRFGEEELLGVAEVATKALKDYRGSA